VPVNSAKPANPEAAVTINLTNQFIAEALGTCVLVVGGVGTAIFAGAKVGWLGVALAFGLSVVVGAYAFGPISGGHFNPAVTIGLWVAGRFPGSKVGSYIVAQVVGGAIGSSLLYLICLGNPGFASSARASGFASNGFGAHSPSGFGVGAAMLTEALVTFIFVAVIIGATSKIANTAFAGLAIGLTLALMHLVAIPITNAGINPARSIAAAIYGGGAAWAQIWVFIIFPVVGGALAGLLNRYVLKQD